MFKHLLVITIVTLASTAFACCNSELKEPSMAVKVVDPTMAVSRIDGRTPIVTVLGTFQNDTENTVSD